MIFATAIGFLVVFLFSLYSITRPVNFSNKLQLLFGAIKPVKSKIIRLRFELISTFSPHFRQLLLLERNTWPHAFLKLSHHTYFHSLGVFGLVSQSYLSSPPSTLPNNRIFCLRYAKHSRVVWPPIHWANFASIFSIQRPCGLKLHSISPVDCLGRKRKSLGGLWSNKGRRRHAEIE